MDKNVDNNEGNDEYDGDVDVYDNNIYNGYRNDDVDNNKHGDGRVAHRTNHILIFSSKNKKKILRKFKKGSQVHHYFETF